jgi:predicted RNA-binding Zn-ribbon protein involved in translation (DUF1610 family)
VTSLDAKPAAARERDTVMRCTHCGLAVHAGAALHDKAVMLASACPRCGGTSLAVPAAADPSMAADPSIYLG